MHPTAVLLLLAKATLVLVAALGATRVLHRAAAGARHLVWLAALGALLLVPALGRWQAVRLEVLPAWVGATPAPAARTLAVGDAALTASSAAPTATATPAVRSAPTSPEPSAAPDGSVGATGGVLAQATGVLAGVGLVPAALAVWAAVALALGVSLAASWLSVRRIVRRALPLGGAEWETPLYEVADRLDLAEAPRLLRSADVAMPFACGLRHPTVVLPAGCDGWTADRRLAVLLHELAHVRRRDLAGHTLARLVCAAYWFHPLVWTAARRLRAESERACDDLALACGARPADYAEHLLDIVTSVRRDATPAAALAMARRSEFEGRMLDILDPERRRGMPTRRQSAALVGALALFATVVGAAAPAEGRAAREEALGGRLMIVGTGTGSDRGLVGSVDTVPAAQSAAERASGDAPQLDGDARVARDSGRTSAVVERVRESVRQAVVDAVATATADASVDAAATATADAQADARMEVKVDMKADARGTARWGALARMGDARDDGRADLLARVLRTDTSASLRRVAAWGLAEYAEEQAAGAALVAAVRADRSAPVREMAAWALADRDDDASARAALSAALRGDADASVRATAAWALGTQGDASAADALAAALGDADRRVRTRAAWALGSVEPRRAPAPLVALLGDPDPGVRLLAAWALYSIEDPATAPALDRALRAERDPKLQRAYVRALATLGEQSVPAIRALLDSADPSVRATAVRALAGGDAAGPWPWPWPQPRPSP